MSKISPRRQIAWSLCVVVIGALIALSSMANSQYHKRHLEQTEINAAYRRLTVPTALTPAGSEWDDSAVNDPSVESAWIYEYQLAEGTPFRNAATALQDDFAVAGFTVHYAAGIGKGAYAFHAYSLHRHLDLSVLVGYQLQEPSEACFRGSDNDTPDQTADTVYVCASGIE